MEEIIGGAHRRERGIKTEGRGIGIEGSGKRGGGGGGKE